MMAAPQSTARITGVGLLARFTPIKGITPKGALDRPLYLPGMADPWHVSEDANHSEYDTLTGGTFSQPAMGDQNARKLRSISIDWLTVDFDAPWLVAVGQDPWWVRSAVTEILRFRNPVQLFVSFNPSRRLPGPEFLAPVTLRSLSHEIRHGELETRYLTMAVSEWRDPQAGRRSSVPPQASSRKKGVHLPTTHVLTATDTLASLSHEYYGRYDYWRHIRDANGITKKFGQKTPIVNLPGRFKVGYKIKIPTVPKSPAKPTGGAAVHP